MKRRTVCGWLAAVSFAPLLCKAETSGLEKLAAELSGFAVSELTPEAVAAAAPALRRILAGDRSPTTEAEALRLLYQSGGLAWRTVPFATPPGSCATSAWDRPWTTS